MKSFHDIVIGYGESDEYSFIFRRETSVFERRIRCVMCLVTYAPAAAYVELFRKC
jgi:tRNA(His) guanylyltransferase